MPNTEKLDVLRKTLYSHVFDSNPVFDKVEMGVNHIVLYPHPTPAGRELLSCIVASMWDSRNSDYFNVYKDSGLLEKEESGVNFVIDHAGLQFSRENFNESNSASMLKHFHPVQSGSYHTHFSYGWQFSGLMALHSVLYTGLEYMSSEKERSRFVESINHCLSTFSQYIADILIEFLPLDEPKMAVLLPYLQAIKDSGLFNVDLSQMGDIPDFSAEDFKRLRGYLIDLDEASDKRFFPDDVIRIFKTFLFELRNYKQHADLMMSAPYLKLGEKNSISELFKLACCFNTDAGKQRIEAVYALQSQLYMLENDVSFHQAEIAEVRRQLGELAISRVAEAPREKIDTELLGARERLGRRMQRNTARSVSEFDEGEVASGEHVQLVHRPETASASGHHTDVSERDRIAAAMFLKKAVIVQESGSRKEEIHSDHWPMIYAAVVNREGSDGQVYMTTNKVHGIIYPNVEMDFQTMLKLAFVLPQEVSLAGSSLAYPQVVIRAHWYDSETKPAKRVSADANVFGTLGTLELLDDVEVLEFPVVPAEISGEMLAGYGARLFRVDEPVSYKEAGAVLYATEYEFRAGYIPQYVLNAEKGGGLFVETHDFPHYFIPLKAACSGGLILGRKGEDDQYQFAAFQIPYGYGLQIDSNVIHGDSFFVGPYAITLTAAVEADSVLLRKQDGAIQAVAQRIVDVTEKEADDLPRLDRGEVQSALMAASRSGLTTFPAMEASSAPAPSRAPAVSWLSVP